MDINTGIEASLLPYSQVITVISTAIIAISAAITAALTWRLICDNRNLTKVGTDPEVVAYLAADPFQPLTNFAFANVGRGPAKNVEFEFVLEECHYGRILLRNEPNRKPHGILLQGEKREMLFGDHRLFGAGEEREKSALRPFQVVVRWQNFRVRTAMAEESARNFAVTVGVPGVRRDGLRCRKGRAGMAARCAVNADRR